MESNSENLCNYDKLRTPPPDAIKQITGGRLQGMSDINPQWRYYAMTNVYGECGKGWIWGITRTWTEEAPEGQRFIFAEVWVKTYMRAAADQGHWSEPIPGIGGSMLIEMESRGLHANDEGYKMAITDALSVALKFLGVAADVYAGHFDSKHNKGTGSPPAAPRPQSGSRPPLAPPKAEPAPNQAPVSQEGPQDDAPPPSDEDAPPLTKSGDRQELPSGPEQPGKPLPLNEAQRRAAGLISTKQLNDLVAGVKRAGIKPAVWLGYLAKNWKFPSAASITLISYAGIAEVVLNRPELIKNDN
jgi:hypothetical protein